MRRFVPRLTELDDRIVPSITLYTPDGSVRGALLHPDPALYHREPELFFTPGAAATVGGTFGWPVYLENATAGDVVRVADKYAADYPLVRVTNEDPGPAVPHTTVHFNVPLPYIQQTSGNPSAVAMAVEGGNEAWVWFAPADRPAAPAAAHEVGHTFTLVHTDVVPNRVMYRTLVTSDAAYLSPDELVAVADNAAAKIEGRVGGVPEIVGDDFQ